MESNPVEGFVFVSFFYVRKYAFALLSILGTEYSLKKYVVLGYGFMGSNPVERFGFVSFS